MSNQLKTRNGIPFDFVDGLRIKGVDVTNWDKVFIDQGASYVGFQPVGNLAASNVQAAIAELESEKQSKSEPIANATTAVNLRPGANQGIVWDNDAFGGTQDTASITLETASGEATKMRFKMTNDSDDNFEFTAKTADGLTVFNNAMTLNGNVILNAANYVDYAAPMIADYVALRAYTGSATQVRITSNGLSGFFYYDAADTTSVDNGGTVIVSSNGKRWKRIYDGAVNVKWFGAKGDWNGTTGTDDTAAIQAALDGSGTYGRVYGQANSTFKITSRINISNKELRDFRFVYTDNNALLVLSGSSRLTNVNISVGSTIRSYAAPLPGVINLHLSVGTIIENLEIVDGITDRIGVFCSTKASNTVIRNCRMNYIGWPILYNDSVPAQRIVDGVDYSGQTIGSGLFITGCELGASDKVSIGDAIEINCPSQRFSNICVTNSTVLKTNSSSVSNGLGFGFANCDVLQVSGCFLKDIAASAGAIHIEAYTCASITNNTIRTSNIGIGAGIIGSDSLITGNAIDSCAIAIQCISNDTSLDGVTIASNHLTNSSGSAIVLLNVISATIANNLIKDITGTGGNRQYISIQQTGNGTSAQCNIVNNIFRKANGQVFPLLAVTGTISEVFSRGNIFPGIGQNEITGYLSTVRSVGLAQDHYRAAGLTSALHGTITTNPTGYVTGTSGDILTDVNAGVIYRYDGTSWVSKVS